MMEYLLQRYSDNGESTLGLWFKLAPLKWQCHTLEDPYRAVKIPGETRIPAGRYELKLRKEPSALTTGYRSMYPWFTWHVEITGVAGYTNVYVHIGNSAKDTHGCVLLGNTANNNQITQGFTGDSTKAFERWYNEVVPILESGERVFLTIRDEYGIPA